MSQQPELHLLVLCQGASRRKLLFHAEAGKDQQDSLELVWQIEQKAADFPDMESCLRFATLRLSEAGYCLAQ
jgi:hypothetical protein